MIHNSRIINIVYFVYIFYNGFMAQNIPVGKLRQNPAEYLHAVSEGERFVITSHRKPIARLVPYERNLSISGTELMDKLKPTHSDDDWVQELLLSRQEESVRDPWNS